MLARCGVLGRVNAHDAERLVGCGRLRGAQAKDAVWVLFTFKNTLKFSPLQGTTLNDLLRK